VSARRAAVLLAVATAAVTSCGGSEDPASPTTSSAGVEREKCAWSVRADAETLNIAYPDTSATYWALSYDLGPGERLELDGRFPEARYASFISYGTNGGPIDVLADRDLVPDPGGANPFVGRAGADGVDAEERSDATFTVTISADGTDGTNPLTAAPGAEEAPTTTAPPRPVEAPEGVRLGSGSDDATSGTTLYRVYLPGAVEDPTGGAGLPDVTIVDADGDRTPVPTCAEPGASERALELVETYGPETDAATPDQPVFIRPGSDAATLYPNPDNVYIATIAEHVPGEVLVVRGRAPELGEQLRYWSVCTNEYRKPYPVSTCVADRDVALDGDGRYVIVISTPEDRPANATAADGATWLDWGAADERNLILVRHMLADPAFGEAATNVAPLGLATDSMGAYAPVGARCTTEAFERDGPDGCPAGSTGG
jgi:hypothetical protein